MNDKPIELPVCVPAETKPAVERAAAAQGLSVSEFIEQAVKKMLAESNPELSERAQA
jgi:uncharacterized protein (DUF1778 family)